MDNRNRDDLNRRDVTPTVGDEVGEAAGGISGVVTGAAIGSLGGPIGTIIGGIAGAIGGWWAGKEISEAARSYTNEDDSFYRSHYESSDARLADRSYADVSPAYQLGHLAGRNPDYAGRSFDTVESDLRRGWDSSAARAHGEWDHVRGFARDAYTRAAAMPVRDIGRTDTTVAANDAANMDSKRLDDSAGYKAF